MRRPTFKKATYQRVTLLFVVLGVGLMGIKLLDATRAAAPTAAIEAEAGIAVSPATQATDSTASGGSTVKFGVAAAPQGELTAQKLTAVKSMRVLFGHQSVGGNMVSGIPALYSSYGVSTIRQIDTSQINTTTGGFFADFYVGENYDPLGKIADFNTTVRRYSTKIDVALFKFCFLDFNGSTNAQQVFNSYRTTMDALVSDFPNIKFLFATGALDEWNTDSAVVREQFNSLIRQQYGSTGRVFDLAKIESTRPDGTRVSGVQGGKTYYQLAGNYSSDGGHLNSTGIRVADTALFNLLAGL